MTTTAISEPTNFCMVFPREGATPQRSVCMDAPTTWLGGWFRNSKEKIAHRQTPGVSAGCTLGSALGRLGRGGRRLVGLGLHEALDLGHGLVDQRDLLLGLGLVRGLRAGAHEL